MANQTLTVKTGFTNVALGGGTYDAGESVVITQAEYDILVEAFGGGSTGVTNLGRIVTVASGGTLVAKPTVGVTTNYGTTQGAPV
jgi:hypothetical protein